MKIYNFKILLITVFTFYFFNPFLSQEKEFKLSDKKFRLELEPASFFLNGAAASLYYVLDEKKNLNLGIYLLSCDVPDFSKQGVFEGVNDNADVRIGFEFAVTGKYKLNLFKNLESNPYIGFIFGWEYFDIQQKEPLNTEKFRISTWIFTPYLSHEIYLYKQMLYLNPQLRGVLYFGQSAPTVDGISVVRNEKITKSYLLPQIGLGLRL